MQADVDMIQPGWTVVDADGEDIGTVVDSQGDSFTVKKGGLMGGEYHVPRTAVTEVETGRVEISMSRKELETAG
jgi:hypothetical protein